MLVELAMPANKKKLTQFSLGVILLALLGGLRWQKEYVYAGWFGGLCLFSGYFGYCLFGRDRTFGVAFLYFSLNALYTSVFRGNHFTGSPEHVRNFLSVQGLIFLSSLFLFSLTLLPQKRRLYLRDLFGGLCLVNSVLVLYGWATGSGFLPQGNGYSGLIDYAGMNGCLIAISYPLFISLILRLDFIYFLPTFFIPILAIFLSNSSVAWGAFLLGVIGTIVQMNWGRHKWLAATITACFCAFVLGFVRIFDVNLFTDGQRFKAYKLFMSMWWEKLPTITGTGPGTFIVLGPEIQIKTKWLVDQTGENVSTFFTFMHSDFLQVMFENGFIGFFLVVIIFLRSLYLSYRKNPATFSALLAYGGVAALNFPLRYFLTALLGASLLTLKNKKYESKDKRPTI